MKIALSLLFFYVVYSNATVINDIILEEWEDWKVFHGKKYGSEEENNFRMKVFIDNKLKIEKHNDLARQGLKTYTMKLNQYSDLLRNEFMSTANSIKSDEFKIQSNEDTETNSNEGITQIIPANVKLPESVDWREHGAVTEIKNQGNCGSCWAFSTTGALEGQHFRKTGKLVSLSEQNLVDCTRSFGPEGCLGGTKDVVDQAFQYIKSNGGIDTEKGYPYLGRDGFCHFKADKIGATDKGFVDIKPMDENALKAAVATIGPVSVLIHASDGFLTYGQGLFDEPECSSTRLNHAVLVVGYGTSEKGEYWLVKNSYGKSWGEEGYIKMSRNKNNQCGIATKASYPVV